MCGGTNTSTRGLRRALVLYWGRHCGTRGGRALSEELVGYTLGGCEILRLIGKGGMGAVYEAWDQKIGRKVALKVVLPHIASDPDFVQRIHREAQAAGRLNHPNVVTVHAVGEEVGYHFIVFEMIEGRDLQEIHAEEGRLEVRRALEIARDVARALGAAHEVGILHRDVKAANVMIDRYGHVRVLDFGIARVGGGETQLTEAGQVLASVAYMSPEQYRAESLDARSDLYSLGVLLFELVVGERPGVDATPLAVAQTAGADPNLGAKLRGVPRPVARLLERLLAVDRRDRPSSAAELDREITTVLAALDRAGTVETRRGVPLRVLAAAAVALALGIGLWLGAEPLVQFLKELWPRDGTPRPTVQLEPPPRYDVGSSATEIEEALELCRQSGERCEREWYATEKLRTVTLAPFLIDTHEVTNGQFAEFVADTGYQTDAEVRGYAYAIAEGLVMQVRDRSWHTPEGPGSSAESQPEHPVVYVSAGDAEAYCAWRGQRLPTAEEWEFAARGRERRRYPWGEEWEATRIGVADAEGGGLHAVGSIPAGATPEGVHDLAGNVWEWTSSEREGGRILKGGSSLDPRASHLRAATEREEDPSVAYADDGFRCAADADPQGATPVARE